MNQNQLYLSVLICLFSAGFICMCAVGVKNVTDPLDAHRCTVIAIDNITETEAIFAVNISNHIVNAYGFKEFTIGKTYDCLLVSHLMIISHGKNSLIIPQISLIISAIIYGFIFVVNLIAVVNVLLTKPRYDHIG